VCGGNVKIIAIHIISEDQITQPAAATEELVFNVLFSVVLLRN
jgi:hypothetical protein